jgi:pentatricopeptide repeat protein
VCFVCVCARLFSPSWSLLVNAYGSGGNPDFGLKRLRELLSDGVKISLHEQTYVPLLMAHAREGKGV